MQLLNPILSRIRGKSQMKNSSRKEYLNFCRRNEVEATLKGLKMWSRSMR